MLGKNLLASRPLIAAAAMMSLAAANQAFACETPMPKNVKIEAAPLSLPSNEARFLGLWQGGFDPGATCSAIAVKEIDKDGNAKLTFAYPAFSYLPPRGSSRIYVKESVQERAGRIENDELKFNTEAGTAINLKFDGDKLVGTAVFQFGSSPGVFVKQ